MRCNYRCDGRERMAKMQLYGICFCTLFEGICSCAWQVYDGICELLYVAGKSLRSCFRGNKSVLESDSMRDFLRT